MFKLECGICHEIYEGSGSIIESFIFDHIHDNRSEIRCVYCGLRIVQDIKVIYHNKTETSEIIKYNIDGLIDLWKSHKCNTMELQELELEEREAEKEEREEIMNEYKAHTERY